VETVADAEAYLGRLSSFGAVLDQETARARANFSAGAVPPDFILETALGQLKGLADQDLARSELVMALTRRTDGLQLPGP
jgi:uncharacterized protein (DUF885 family)